MKTHSYLNAANLVQAGGLTLLSDAGRGAGIRVGQPGQAPGTLDAVFLTHFHSDHVNGLVDIFLTGDIPGATLTGRTEAMDLHGPTATQERADGTRLAHRRDTETRIVDEGTPDLAERPVIQKILAHHTSPEDVGRVFQRAAPKRAVYTQMVLLGRPPVTEVIEQTRRHYDGPLVAGEDLMQFVLTDSGPTVHMAGR